MMKDIIGSFFSSQNKKPNVKKSKQQEHQNPCGTYTRTTTQLKSFHAPERAILKMG
jgi:hypothetical protein